MNENINIDLTKILKDAPKGTVLWSSMCGECTLQYIDNLSDFPITCLAVDKYGRKKQVLFTKYGQFCSGSEFVYSECVLFPSKENRDWSTFKMENKDKHLDFRELIENEVINNLRIKITTDYDGYVEAELLYKGKVISDDTCQVSTDSNPLDE